jgi:hypothetical protein
MQLQPNFVQTNLLVYFQIMLSAAFGAGRGGNRNHFTRVLTVLCVPERVCATIRLALLALLAGSGLAHTEPVSGQYPGVYVLEGLRAPQTPTERLALEYKCTLAPSTMNAAGEGSGLIFDRETFNQTGAVSYIEGHRYRCTYDPVTRLESCNSTEFMGGMGINYEPLNGYHTFTEDLQSGYSLDTPEAAAAWRKTGTTDPTTSFAYHRCQCLDTATLAPLVSARTNTISSGETNWRLFRHRREPQPAELELGRKVLDRLKGCLALKGS